MRNRLNILHEKFAAALGNTTGAVLLCLAGVLIAVGGCSKNGEQPAAENSAGPAASTHAAIANVRITVIDDPELAQAIDRLRGEWKAQTGSELQIEQMSAANVNSAEKLDADSVLYPPALLGTLAERRLIRPLNKDWLKEDPLEIADLLLLLDSPELTWDGQPYAVPLGSPVLVLMYRPDLFEQLGKQPPRTWEEYQTLADFFNNPKQLRAQQKQTGTRADSHRIDDPWSGAVEPLAPGWAARTLLARAAAYARHRDYFSVLFDRETMEPLIGGPPFVRALTELVAAAKMEPKEAASFTPAEAARWLLSGHAAMAIGWPAALVQMSRNTVVSAFAPLPGSTAAYNPRQAEWEPRRNDESVNIPLVGVGGHVGSVVKGTNSAETAFHLLTWLSSNRWSSELLPTNPAATLFRQSQANDSSTWFGHMISAEAAKQYSQVLATALHQPEAVQMLRIPGEAEYMAALDDAVRAAISGKKSPQQALNEAAEQWKKITAQYGVNKQREAYRRSLKAAP
ncbi:MAG TPA: extracellular solute-binding protein [Pirellulales bacterium]|nr:extracellular solute-binding protein [Pirellulales bacterium]